MGDYPFAASPVNLGQTWAPSDDSLITANYDPVLADAATQVTAGALYLTKLQVRQTAIISNLWFGITVSGAGTSTGTFVGLYSAAGTLLTGSADVGGPGNGTFATPFESVKIALSTPQQIIGGSWVWAAMLINLSVTMPTLYRALSDAAFVGLTDWNGVSSLRFAVNGTGLTALPATITPGSNSTSNARSWWTGAS